MLNAGSLGGICRKRKKNKIILYFYNRMSFHDSFLLWLLVFPFLCRILETTHLHHLRNQNEYREQRFEKLHFQLTQKKAWREKVFSAHCVFSNIMQ